MIDFPTTPSSVLTAMYIASTVVCLIYFIVDTALGVRKDHLNKLGSINAGKMFLGGRYTWGGVIGCLLASIIPLLNTAILLGGIIPKIFSSTFKKLMALLDSSIVPGSRR